MSAEAKSDGRLVFDCLSAVLLLLVAVFGAYLPKYLAKHGSLQPGTASSLAFHLGNMLSGGVMLSAGFCHLLADALRQLAFIGRFPIAPFLAATGYLITLLADQVVQLLTTDAEDQQQQQQQLMSPGFGGPPDDPSQVISRAGPGQGFRPSPSPSPAGSGFAGFLRSGLGQKTWGYSRLEDSTQQHQQHHQQGSSYHEGSIELMQSNGVHHNSSSTGSAAGAAAPAAISNVVAALRSHADGSLIHHQQQQQQPAGCCHNPSSCACCVARSSVGEPEGSRAPSTAVNPGIHSQQLGSGQGIVGFSRRPGSAGGLDRSGLGLGSVARTRSLTSPVVAPALSPLQAAAACELGGQPGTAAAAAGAAASPVGHADAGSTPPLYSAAAAAAPPPHVLLVSTVAPVVTAAAVAGGVSSGHDDALCLLAAGSPRSISAGGLHPRSPKFKSAAAAAGLTHQQQQNANGHHAQHEQQQQPPLPLQQQQQQLVSPSELQAHRTNSSIGSLLLQPVRQLSLPTCGCCCGGGVCRSALPSAQPDMTEACTVARVAGHLELEVMSTTTGGHNHGHFQVFLSQRPLSFATSLLLACALCIHSILEGLALGAQQSMQATEDIMLAIAAHKGLAAYALGASIVESGASDSKFWVVVCLFAAATPLGIAIGYASSVLGHGPVSAAMSALASGTFLYVALNEVIPKELEHPDGHRLAKVAALLLGFGLMSLLAVWA